MNRIVLGKFVALYFEYELGSNFPSRINGYQLKHDRHGGLSKIITPLGFEHSFQTVPLIGSSLIHTTTNKSQARKLYIHITKYHIGMYLF